MTSRLFNNMSTHQDVFQQRCNSLREFIVFRERLPKRKSQDSNERSLACFIETQRLKQKQDQLTDERIAVLNSVNKGLLAWKLKLHRNDNTKAYDEWEQYFDTMKGRNTNEELRAYSFASTNEPFIPQTSPCKSFEEFFIRKMRCHQFFSPQECHPDTAKPASMQSVVSYMLHPHTRPNHRLRSGFTKHSKNVADPLSPPFHHTNSGTFFPGSSQTQDFLLTLDNAINSALPNNLLAEMKSCLTLDAYEQLERENVHLYDTFHYGENGQGSSELVRIMDSSFPQPRRMGFSCYFDDEYFFPSLGVPYRQLFSYGASGRPAADGRSRPMPVPIFNLGIAAWKNAHSTLCNMCQICPPNNVQVVLYPELRKSHMRMHRDNGRKDWEIMGSSQHANHDTEMNSHFFGSDVMSVTAGDTMTFDLVKPIYSKGQDYRIGTKTARNNFKKYMGDPRDLLQSVHLDHGSTYIHTAHDDEMYFHRAYFEKGTPTNNKVRVAFIYRWLSVPAYYRQSPNDIDDNRYSMVNKHAFQKVNQLPTTSSVWWNALGYGNGESIRNLMDPM